LAIWNDNKKNLQTDLEDATSKLDKASAAQKGLEKYLKKAEKDLADAKGTAAHAVGGGAIDEEHFEQLKNELKHEYFDAKHSLEAEKKVHTDSERASKMAETTFKELKN